jgi:UDP-N-acetylmuramoylalanine--D-glutamate ligase
MVPFSLNPSLAARATVMDGTMYVQISNNQLNPFTMLSTQLALRGRHNAYNSLAAALIGKALEIKNEVIREALTDFKNVEHRLENVATVDGIQFINDSKATNVNAAWYALECMDKPVVWIAGGTDKGNDYSMLKELVKSKVRIIVCMGLDNSKIHEAFSKDVDMIVNTTSAIEAVKVAKQLSKSGECVLLSPACASFDLFKNYEERGRLFKNAVKNL